MKVLTRKLGLMRIAVIAMIVTMAMPITSLAQGRGRGRGRNFDRFDRKCGKCVNCHDARDGRWDGRGPNRSRFDDRFRFGRFRDRDFDNDDFRRLQRRRRFRDRIDDDDFRRWERRRRVRDRILQDEFRRRQLIQYRNYRYQSDPYYNNNYGYQRGFNWASLLNMFLQ
ncbi:MAG: hypothetical protein ACREBC_18990 [Pyrinomonadaceae bacterium]